MIQLVLFKFSDYLCNGFVYCNHCRTAPAMHEKLSNDVSSFYPHMLIDTLGIYHLLLFVGVFVCPQHQDCNGQVNGQGMGCHATPLPPSVTTASHWPGCHTMPPPPAVTLASHHHWRVEISTSPNNRRTFLNCSFAVYSYC